MISEKQAKIFCCEDIRNIENYERASKDLVEVWHLHHRKEEEGFSRQELKNAGLYFKRPACELIFLTKTEHMSLHNKGKKLSEEHRRKISEAKKGRKLPEFTGEKHYKSKPVYQIDKNTGEIIKIWPCTWEVQRQLGIANNSISRCCTGKRKSAGGFVWIYKQ